MTEQILNRKIALEIQQELDRIAQKVSEALATFDSEPNPGALDGRVNGTCRICRLLWDRGRSIASFVERDPGLLDTETTASVLRDFSSDLEKHKRTTYENSVILNPNEVSQQRSHDPMVNYTRAMLDQVRVKR